MANDYFQDITPPSDDSIRRSAAPRPPTPQGGVSDDGSKEVPIRIDGAGQAPRGIRSILPMRAIRSRIGDDVRQSARAAEGAPMPGITGAPPRSRGASSRFWMWGAAALGLVVVGGLGLLAFRSTTVTVTPRFHAMALTSATSFTAYPATIAASGTLSYTVKTADLEDSTVVPVSGTTTSAASKASGSITVYNGFSTAPVKLLKTTRFQTQGGLIFRVPADVSVPGKSAAGPGSVKVTVVADAAGEKYNVGPVSRLTLPGLKSNAAMYSGVYAKSSEAMTGGSSGVSGPGVSPSALSAAVTKLQDSLLAKARDTAGALAGQGEMVLADLIQITYETQPNTAEAGGGARVHETAHVRIPAFNTLQLGKTVGAAVSADADNSLITLVPGADFAAHLSGTEPDLSSGPLQFTLTGTANLIWNVDTQSLAAALAGRDEGAFQTVIAGFSGIEEAHAKIEPFWKNSFPSNPGDIKVVVTEPKAAQ